MLHTTRGYACWAEVTLDDIVYLERHLANEAPLRVFATVWEASQMWMAGKDELPSAARRGIREKIDAFCHDFRAAQKLEANLLTPVRDEDSD